MDQDSLRLVLLLGLSGADLSTDLAARTVPHLRRQFEFGHRRRYRLYARAGIGSLAGGWLSRRRKISLLPLLAAIEIITAAFGVVSLGVFEKVGALVVNWPLPAMAAVNLLLVIVPTLLMGATLPILVSHLVRRSGQVGDAVGLLYYVNTLGAGAACLVCGIVLFPFFGMHSAVYTAVSLNVAVAAGAMAAHVLHPDEPRPYPSSRPAALARRIAGYATGVAAGGAWRVHLPCLMKYSCSEPSPMHPGRARPHLQSRWRAFSSASRAAHETRPRLAKR